MVMARMFEIENAATPMDVALEEARAAATRGEVPIGAVIVHAGNIIARSGNRTRELNDVSAHAELLAIRAAGEALQAERLNDCDLYVTLEPCAMCAAAISFARIRRLYYGASDPKGGGVEHGGRFYTQPTCHHVPEVYGGFSESEAREILKKFFREKR
ncbi:nucleoside deaminase [Brucella sp. BE17]|uniref:nucleoside deaminase n=1 Tax=Brucella sp. BE17 TaxID=3142977 RepID=UPI0031BB30C3